MVIKETPREKRERLSNNLSGHMFIVLRRDLLLSCTKSKFKLIESGSIALRNAERLLKIKINL